MAVPLATRVVRYVATAGQTTFPYGWLALAATDFLVQRTRSGVTTTLVHGVDYTATGIGNPAGGNIVPGHTVQITPTSAGGAAPGCFAAPAVVG